MNMSNISQYLKTAFEYKNSGNYKEAIDYFYKALALDNDSLEIICELAFLYGKLCQYDRAVSLYEQFLQKNPDDNSVKYNYAMLCKQIKNYVKAEKILIELFEKGYDINRVAGELFEIFLKNKEYEKIISYYIRKTNVLNTSLNLYYIGLAYLKTGKRNIAEELFKKSFELDKNNIESGIIIVEMLFEQELYSEAEELILQLLKLSENDRLFYILSKLIYIFAFCLLYALAQLAVNAVIGYAYNRDNFVIYDPERDDFTVGRFYLMYAAYTLNGVAAGTLTLFLCNLFGREYVVLAVLLAYMYFFSTAFYGIINDIVQNAFDPDFEIEFYTVYGQGRMSGQSMEDEKYLTMLFVSLGYTALFTLLSWLAFRRRSC